MDSNNMDKYSAQPSGIFHGFDVAYAIAYGVDEAIMIKNFQHFITYNAHREKNFHEGRYWTYDKLEDFIKHFPYWTVKQVRRILASLIKQEVIIKGEFNDKWSDRTSWYAFKDEANFVKFIKPPKKPSPDEPKKEKKSNETIDLPKQANGENLLPKRSTASCPNGQLPAAQMGNCIYGTTTITTTINNTSPLSSPQNNEKEKQESPIGDDINFSSKSKKKIKKEFSPLVIETTQKMIDILRKNITVYRPPSNLTKFHEDVEKLFESEKQDINQALKAFEWATKDNEKRGTFTGWQGIIAKHKMGRKETSPAGILSDNLVSIHSQMTSRVARKFAPSSDEEAMDKAMEEMNRHAI